MIRKGIRKTRNSMVNAMGSIDILIDLKLNAFLSKVKVSMSNHFARDTIVRPSFTMLSIAKTIVSRPFLVPKNQ